MIRLVATFVLVALVVLFNSCGGGAPDLLSGGQPDGEAAVVITSRAPTPGNLPEPGKALSINGPGWYSIDPNDPSMRLVESGNIDPGGGVRLDSAAGTAFAVFGVAGFEGDCFPTSVRVTVNYLSGSYYIGYCDYTAGTWQYAGPYSGSSTSEIPDIDEYTSPTAFVSPEGWFYVMVIVEDGSEVGLAELELGVHGGSNAPAMPFYVRGLGGALWGGPFGVNVNWENSVDYLAPDFSGYYVERAPVSAGDYTRLNSSPRLETWFLDETVEMDELYRYRVSAVDTSGNQSAWLPFTVRTNAAVDTTPVASLAVPRGVLRGAQDVTFDMSGSFDPNGVGITNYELDLGHRAPTYSGASAVVDLHLQPGCYRVVCRVTSAAATSLTVRHLKVYPQWEAVPELVVAPDELWTRAVQFRTAVNPATETPVLFWYDRFSLGLIALEEDGQARHLPVEESGAVYLGETMVAGDVIRLPFIAGDRVGLARYEGGEFSYEIAPGIKATGDSCATYIGPYGLPYLACVQPQLLATYDLVVISPFDIGTTISNDVDADCKVDVVSNPATGEVFYVFSTGGVTWCATVQNGLPVSLEMAYDKHATGIDVELNPATGRPVSAYFFADAIYYNEQNVDGTWPAPDRVIAGGADRPDFDLVAIDAGIFIAFAQVGGALKVRQYSGGTWDGFATIDYGGVNSGNGIALCPLPAGGFIMPDIADDDITHLCSITGDGAVTTEVFLPRSEYVGLDMSAAAAPDYLHLVWQAPGDVIHYIRDPGTGAWSASTGVAGAIKPAIMGDILGDVYLAYVVAGTAFLDQWAGGWVALEDAPVSDNTRPIVTAQPFTEYLYWYVNNDDVVPERLHASRIHAGAGFPGDSDIEISPLWAGTVFVEEFYEELFTLAGGVYIGNSSTGVYNTWPGSVQEIFRNSSYGMSDSMLIRGKLVDTSGFNYVQTEYSLPAYWVAYGPGGGPARIARTLSGYKELTSLEDSSYLEHGAGGIDGRRTVTAALGHGLTAVGLVASMDGRATWFEWDDFGNWEDLELPVGLEYMSMPELVVDWDGRWHLLYRHLITGEVLCWSTTE